MPLTCPELRLPAAPPGGERRTRGHRCWKSTVRGCLPGHLRPENVGSSPLYNPCDASLKSTLCLCSHLSSSAWSWGQSEPSSTAPHKRMSTLPGGQAAAPKSRQRLLFPVRQERSQHLSYISAQVRRPRASGTPKSQVQCSGSRGTDYRISSMCPPAFPLRCLHRGMLLVSALSNDSEQSHASEGLWPLPTGAKLI